MFNNNAPIFYDEYCLKLKHAKIRIEFYYFVELKLATKMVELTDFLPFKN